MNGEQTKALEETAKTVGKLAEITEKVGSFFKKIAGPCGDQIGEILGDRARYYRYKNLLSIADKVEVILSKRKIDGKPIPIPPRIAIPLLESASIEENETLQDIWAKLIANGTNPGSASVIHPGYIEVIKQMSPDEAIILYSFAKFELYPTLFSYEISEIYRQSPTFPGKRPRNANRPIYEGFYELFLNHCRSLSLIKPNDSKIYLDNLIRLRIIEFGYNFMDEKRSRNPRLLAFPTDNTKIPTVVIPGRQEFLKMTSFGQSLLVACVGEENTP